MGPVLEWGRRYDSKTKHFRRLKSAPQSTMGCLVRSLKGFETRSPAFYDGASLYLGEAVLKKPPIRRRLRECDEGEACDSATEMRVVINPSVRVL
jgi:hypothetical protein